MVQAADKYTAEEFYQSAKDHYKLAIESERNNVSQDKIDACWGVTAQEFWWALTLGSAKAPLALFKCFWQGVGVKKNDDIAGLMYGAALQFTPGDCAKIPDSSKPSIDKSMQLRINELVKLVRQTHARIPAEGVTMEKVFGQMDKFNHAIKLPSGKLIQSCFTEKIIQANSKEKDLQSDILQITKNLSTNNKPLTTIATNHRSSNRVTSKIGCSIS
jgi:hypothetical protein